MVHTYVCVLCMHAYPHVIMTEIDFIMQIHNRLEMSWERPAWVGLVWTTIANQVPDCGLR